MSESDISNLRAQLAEQQAELLAVRAEIAALGERVPVPSSLAEREAKVVSALEHTAAALRACGVDALVVVHNQALNQGVQGTNYGSITINNTNAPEPFKALRQLRAPVADFVGREDEVVTLVTTLRGGSSGRTAAISGVRGMGGIGKTELAYAVAAQLQADYPDAQILLELRGASDTPLRPEQALQQVIQAFRPQEKLPEELSALQALYRSVLAGQRVLLLADDAKDAAQVRSLQPPAGSALLVTSRQRFVLDGMTVLDLDRLDEGVAVQLLHRICDRLGEDQAQEIARLCGYLPLALRVSAGILTNDPSLSVARYLTQLADERRRLALLRDPDEPKQDVAATLHLSYARLDQPIQVVFRQLGMLAADAELGLIVAVQEQREEEAEAVLRLLLRRSLVEYDVTRERWGMHDLVRVFALERLAEAGEEQAARLRYAEQVIRILAQAEQQYLKKGGDGVLAGLARFDREHAHLEAVRTWLWAQPPEPTIDTLLWDEAFASWYIENLRDPVRVVRVPRWNQAAAVARRRSDLHGEGSALGKLGDAYRDLGEARTALGYYEQQLAITREVGDRRGEGMALGNLGAAYSNLGEARKTIGYFEQQLAITREVGDRRGEGIALGNLGAAYSDLGEERRAIGYYEQCLAIAREVGDWHGEGITLGNLGIAWEGLGSYPEAHRFYEQQLHIYQKMGDRRGEADALDALGTTHYLLGNFAEALTCCEASLALAQELGDRSLEGTVLRDLANVQAAFRQPIEADANYVASLAIHEEMQYPSGRARTCWTYGQFLVRQGSRERGIALLAECVAYEHQIGHVQAEKHAALVEHLRAGGELPAL